ncbi:hypothetical protein NDU88_006275 [Pleurodeles waltl]|uniref:Uncharacterized protein n=1 Tax=Pleurodeles waltl TaxID=8319 RepID=A0AAV7TD05_PLEWA|nr:hypothetical protein NDU88_006275 [Pleurodeles waltl]
MLACRPLRSLEVEAGCGKEHGGTYRGDPGGGDLLWHRTSPQRIGDALPRRWLMPQPAVKGESSWDSQALLCGPYRGQATMEQERACTEVELRVGSPASLSSVESVEQQGQEFLYVPQLLLLLVLGGAVSLHDPSLRAWEVAGIVEWGDLFEDHMQVLFDNIVNNFGVSPGTFMAYAVVTRQAAVRCDTLPREPDTSILLQTLLTHGGERKDITNIYKALHMEARCPLTSLRAYWEDVLCVKLTDTQWEQALMVPKMISVNAYLVVVCTESVHFIQNTQEDVQEFMIVELAILEEEMVPIDDLFGMLLMAA